MNRDESLLKMRQVLLHRREAIQAALQGDLAAIQQLSLAHGDLAEIALDSSHEEVASVMAEVESHELTKISDAIDRMNSGSYGACIGCDRSIPLARLRALPYATLCIQCQTKLEESGFEDWSELVEQSYDDS